MNKERIKVYTYKRVSTAMQIDGYSLDAQRSRMKAYADFNDYEIVGEYEDAGKSGKSIEGRMQFRQMMEDVKSENYKPKFHHVYTIPSFHIMLNFFYFTSSIYTIKSRLRQGVRGDGRGSKPV